MYMDTYPPDAAGSSPEPRSTVVTPRTKTPDIVDVVYRAKQKPKIRRTYVKKTVSWTKHYKLPQLRSSILIWKARFFHAILCINSF